MNILERSHGNPTLYYMNYLRPLPILKQICAMFASVNGPEFFEKNVELRKFVLNKERKYLPEKYRIYAYYNVSNRFRRAGLSGVSNLFTGDSRFMSEISYPPFGYLMTLSSQAPDERLMDITPFACYDFGRFIIGEIRMNVLPTVTPYPGDYRDLNEIGRNGIARPHETCLYNDKSITGGHVVG